MPVYHNHKMDLATLLVLNAVTEQTVDGGCMLLKACSHLFNYIVMHGPSCSNVNPCAKSPGQSRNTGPMHGDHYRPVPLYVTGSGQPQHIVQNLFSFTKLATRVPQWSFVCMAGNSVHNLQ